MAFFLTKSRRMYTNFRNSENTIFLFYSTDKDLFTDKHGNHGKHLRNVQIRGINNSQITNILGWHLRRESQLVISLDNFLNTNLRKSNFLSSALSYWKNCLENTSDSYIFIFVVDLEMRKWFQNTWKRWRWNDCTFAKFK